MIIKEQVELARPGSKIGIDFELVDYSDGQGQQIRKVSASFTIPTTGELNAVRNQADQKKARRAAARENVRNGQSGNGLPDAIRRIKDLEDIIEELL